MPVGVLAPPAADQPDRRGTGFARSHPLAGLVARHHKGHADRPARGFVVGCAACWELAIRDDERFIIECDLPRGLEPDLSYVDEIAVGLACQGKRRGKLTDAERTEAVARLTGWGVAPSVIASRLGMNTDSVSKHLPAPVLKHKGRPRASGRSLALLACNRSPSRTAAR
jgi:hypothetical protein